MILEDQMGVEVVRFETGNIPYHTASTLSEACLKEIDNCNVLVSIIGGRYGSIVDLQEDDDNINREKIRGYAVSVSRLEVERAVQSGLLLFAFVDADVLAQYRVYLANLENASDINWPSVDDTRIFDFIKYIYDLPGRNPLFAFRTPREIQDTLRAQLAGLFCDLLEREKEDKFGSHLDQVISSAERLQVLQAQLANREAEAERRMGEMVLPDHRLYTQIKEAMGLKYRAFFRTVAELKDLVGAHGFEEVSTKEIPPKLGESRLYFKKDNPTFYLSISRRCFKGTEGSVNVDEIDNDENIVWSGESFPK